MPVKRAEVPDDAFNNRSAIEKLTGVPAGQSATLSGAEEQDIKTTEERKQKPTSFYLDDETLRRLDRLAYEYNGQTGKRINRNHIVRFLTAKVELGDLLQVNLKDY